MRGFLVLPTDLLSKVLSPYAVIFPVCPTLGLGQCLTWLLLSLQLRKDSEAAGMEKSQC